jgi:hypothetical protein
MKYLSIFLMTAFLIIGTISSSNAYRFNSNYDRLYDITVTDCKGNTTVYHNCVITDTNFVTLSFIPNSSRISVSREAQIIIILNSCTSIIMNEID